MNASESMKLSTFYDEGNCSALVNLVKFLLMPFVFFALLGSPFSGKIGDAVTAFSGFAALAFFILCGFFVLVPDPDSRMEKIVRGLRRALIFFAILFFAYFAISAAYMHYAGILDQLLTVEFLRLRTFFNFFVLNVWALPVGGGIWFIQSLLYAYVFFFLVEKLRLSKLYLPFLILFLLVSLLGGELAKVVGFPYLGYAYIPGNAWTKAIPFMLVGMFLRRYLDKLSRIPRFVYIITFFVGILCALGEQTLLSRLGLLVYTGNAVGYAVMAISVCLFAVTKPEANVGFLGLHGGNYARRMYAFCQPVSFALWFVCVSFLPDALMVVTRFQSLVCFALCFGLATLIGWIKFKILTRDS